MSVISTSSKGKDFTLYTHANGPNGWKVAHLLEELGLEYESVYLDFQKGEQKSAGLEPKPKNPRLICRVLGPQSERTYPRLSRPQAKRLCRLGIRCGPPLPCQTLRYGK
jgi:Glutathione S-transferase, N-terminal domain